MNDTIVIHGVNCKFNVESRLSREHRASTGKQVTGTIMYNNMYTSVARGVKRSRAETVLRRLTMLTVQ